MKCLILDTLVQGEGRHREAKQSFPPSGEGQGGRAGPGERRYLEEWVQTEEGSSGPGPQESSPPPPPDAELLDVRTSTHGVGVGEQGEE